MSNDFKKMLLKLSKKELEKFLEIREKIKNGDLNDLDFKKLEGVDDNYRVRFGNYRII